MKFQIVKFDFIKFHAVCEFMIQKVLFYKVSLITEKFSRIAHGRFKVLLRKDKVTFLF